MFLSTYSFKFLRHVENFMTNQGLFPPSGKMLVASSTGLDSMVLLQVMELLLERGKIQKLEVIHINHGTREECDMEEEFLRKYCQQRQLTLHVKKLKGLEKGNFEARARELRYLFFQQFLKKGDRLCTAHHLDDSFEWYQLQQLKNSNPDILGIPLQRGRIIRPFLCVTKAQINRYAVKNDLKYFEDKSNFDLSFERNWLRHETVGKMKKRFPKMLKHYAHRSNRIISERVEGKKTFHHIDEDKDFGIHVRFENIPTAGEIILWIKKLSNKEKGSLANELSKLLSAIEAGSQGPMHFSGGVKIYFNRSEMLIVNDRQLKNYEALDKNLMLGLPAKMSVDQVLRLQLPFPRFLLITDPWLQSKLSPVRKIHPLFPRFTAHLLQNNQWFCSANQLKQLCLKQSELLKMEISIINLQAPSIRA